MNTRLLLLTVAVSAALPLAAQTNPLTARAPSRTKAPGTEVEVRKPAAFDESESRVLRSLDTMPLDRLVQIMQVYERMDNVAMLDAVVKTVLRRDPKNADALRIRDGGQLDEVVRAPGYLEELGKKVLAGQKVDDADAVPALAMSRILDNHAADAVTLLQALRKNQFQGTTFPYLDDLGYALAEAGRLDESVAAYQAVLADPKQSEEAKGDARAVLPGIELKRSIASLQKSIGHDVARLLAESKKLLDAHPNDDEAISFRIDALNATGHSTDAVAMLLRMRREQGDVQPWPWLPELAFSYYGARDFDRAIATFREIQKNKEFDDVTRREAESMIVDIQVARLIETGTYALDCADNKKAAEVLATLERDYKTHREVLGYRALFLAKTGHSDQALKELLAQKQKDAAQQLPFSQQDALADVYLERKEYNKAREATWVIINDARYDLETRNEAVADLRKIDVEEASETAYLAIQQGDRAKARRIADDLARIAPGSPESKLVDAEVALAYFHAREARDGLLSIRDVPPPQGFKGLPFPGQNTLGAALAQLGDWQGAYEAYGVVTSAPGYDVDDVWDATWERRELQAWFKPTLSVKTTFTHEGEGNLFDATIDYKGAWVGDWRFGAFEHTVWPRLSKQSIFGKRNPSPIVEGGVTAMRRFENGYFAEASIGASNDDVIYGVRVGKLAYNSLGWSLGFVGNALSADSTSLQAVNGRENRVELKVAGPLSERWQVDLNAWYQWNRVGGARLGEGYGLSGELAYILQTETRKRPELSIGYTVDYSRFSQAGRLPPRISDEIRRAQPATEELRRALAPGDEVRRALAGNYGNEVFDSLVDPYTNRQGLVLRARKHFEKLAVSAHIGGYYAFDDAAAGWTAGVAAEYWLSERAMIYAELSYDSDGKGASAGGGVWEAVIGGQMSF